MLAMLSLRDKTDETMGREREKDENVPLEERFEETKSEDSVRRCLHQVGILHLQLAACQCEMRVKTFECH